MKKLILFSKREEPIGRNSLCFCFVFKKKEELLMQFAGGMMMGRVVNAEAGGVREARQAATSARVAAKVRSLRHDRLRLRRLSRAGREAELKSTLREVLSGDAKANQELDTEELLRLEQVLMKELLEEELHVLAKMEEEDRRAREREIEHYAQMADACSLPPGVLCPFCKANDLVKTMSTFHCNCGFRIDSRQDCMTLGQFGSRLESGYQAHRESPVCCPQQPFCRIENKFGIQMVVLQCPGCSFCHIVV